MGTHFKNYGAMLPGRHQYREVFSRDKLVLASLGAIGRGWAGNRHDRLKGSRVTVGENFVCRKAMKKGGAIAEGP